MKTFMNWTIRVLFIGCNIAFMWASIHHLAAFFGGFEPQNQDAVGAYMLAGAVDITALVLTIAAMFFRKQMPTAVFVLVWVFIVGLAGYSFVMNWEYAVHYQSATLLMQPTGKLLPVYDVKGTLHYVPEMVENTTMSMVNPFLASGFTLLSLVYAIVAEFFGAKKQTAEEMAQELTELKAMRKFKEEKREAIGEKKSLIQQAKEKAIETKSALKEIRNAGQIAEGSEEKAKENWEETLEELVEITKEIPEELSNNLERNPEEMLLISLFPEAVSWLDTGDPTVSLDAVKSSVIAAGIHPKTWTTQVKKEKCLRHYRGGNVSKSSAVSWVIATFIPKEKGKILSLDAARKNEGNTGNLSEDSGEIPVASSL